jgi:hypothetical protein
MERSVMNKLLASIFGILLATGLAIAEPPDGKGKDKEQTPGPIQVYAQGVSIGRYMGGVFGNSPFGIRATSSLLISIFSTMIAVHRSDTWSKFPRCSFLIPTVKARFG